MSLASLQLGCSESRREGMERDLFFSINFLARLSAFSLPTSPACRLCPVLGPWAWEGDQTD